MYSLFLKKIDFIYLFLERGEGGRKRARETSVWERNINWLPPAHPQLGTWPATQACALTWNWTSDLGLKLNLLNNTRQGKGSSFFLTTSVILSFNPLPDGKLSHKESSKLPLSKDRVGISFKVPYTPEFYCTLCSEEMCFFEECTQHSNKSEWGHCKWVTHN